MGRGTTLTEEQRDEVLARLRAGELPGDVAADCGISTSYAKRLAQRSRPDAERTPHDFDAPGQPPACAWPGCTLIATEWRVDDRRRAPERLHVCHHHAQVELPPLVTRDRLAELVDQVAEHPNTLTLRELSPTDRDLARLAVGRGHLVLLAGRLCPPPPKQLRQPAGSAQEEPRMSSTPSHQQSRTSTILQIVLEQGPLSAAQIGDRVGLSGSSVCRYLYALRMRGEIERAPLIRPYLWARPGHWPTEAEQPASDPNRIDEPASRRKPMSEHRLGAVVDPHDDTVLEAVRLYEDEVAVVEAEFAELEAELQTITTKVRKAQIRRVCVHAALEALRALAQPAASAA